MKPRVSQPHFPSNTDLLECTVLLLGAEGESDLLQIVHYRPPWKRVLSHMRLAYNAGLVLVIVSIAPVTLPNPRSIRCLGLWIKLAIAGDFGRPHLSASFSQVPPLLEQRLPWFFFLIMGPETTRPTSHRQKLLKRLRFQIFSHWDGKLSGIISSRWDNEHFVDRHGFWVFTSYHFFLASLPEATRVCAFCNHRTKQMKRVSQPQGILWAIRMSTVSCTQVSETEAVQKSPDLLFSRTYW